jgi:hypothetical protein
MSFESYSFDHFLLFISNYALSRTKNICSALLQKGKFARDVTKNQNCRNDYNNLKFMQENLSLYISSIYFTLGKDVRGKLPTYRKYKADKSHTCSGCKAEMKKFFE